MRSRLGPTIIGLAVLELAAAWGFALPRLIGPGAHARWQQPESIDPQDQASEPLPELGADDSPQVFEVFSMNDSLRPTHASRDWSRPW